MAKENQIVSRIVSLAVECVRIEPPAEFGFAWGLEFRRQCQSGSADCAYVLDLRHTRVLDTAALGMLPLAYGIGSGADMLRPLAIAVIGALAISVLLSLVATPTLYYLMLRRQVSAGPHPTD